MNGFDPAAFEKLVRERNSWGRWGDDDQVGALNLVTAQKRVATAGLVRTGRSVSLSREFPLEAAARPPSDPGTHSSSTAGGTGSRRRTDRGADRSTPTAHRGVPGSIRRV